MDSFSLKSIVKLMFQPVIAIASLNRVMIFAIAMMDVIGYNETIH